MPVLNYDRNIRWAIQKVKITLGAGAYRAERIVEIGGNRKGCEIFDAAVEQLLDELRQEAEPGLEEGEADLMLLLKDESGDEILTYENEEDHPDHWLKKLIIGMEIIDIRKEE